PDFARLLERRILARQRPVHRWWEGILPRPLRAHPLRVAALFLFLLLFLLGSSVSVAAALVTNPTNPLYALKTWEQHLPVALGSSPTDQAEGALQGARDRLNRLPDLADEAQTAPYRHALMDFDQHLMTTAQAIAALPAGADRTRLTSELNGL